MRCVYYVSENGRTPVKEFIDSLEITTQAKFFSTIALLETFGQKLKRPHAASLREGIHELRFVGRERNIRVLYFFFDHQQAVLTNGFIKKQSNVPNHEINKAIKRKKAYFLRKERKQNGCS